MIVERREDVFEDFPELVHREHFAQTIRSDDLFPFGATQELVHPVRGRGVETPVPQSSTDECLCFSLVIVSRDPNIRRSVESSQSLNFPARTVGSKQGEERTKRHTWAQVSVVERRDRGERSSGRFSVGDSEGEASDNVELVLDTPEDV